MAIFNYKSDIPADFILDGDIAIDTETMGLNLYRDRLCVLQFSNGNGDVHIVTFCNDYQAPNLKKFLNDNNREYIFHFARFDIAIIKKYLDIDFKRIFCTKISSKLVRTYTESHGLKELCREILGVNLSKAQQSSDWGNMDLSSEQLDYAARDVLYLHELRSKLTLMLKREGRDKIAAECFSFLNSRAKLDLLGWNDLDIFAH